MHEYMCVRVHAWECMCIRAHKAINTPNPFRSGFKGQGAFERIRPNVFFIVRECLPKAEPMNR